MAISRTYTIDYTQGGDKIGPDSVIDGAVKKLDEELTLAYGHLNELQKNYSLSTAPSGAQEGQLWWKSDDDLPKIYDGANWLNLIHQSRVNAYLGLNQSIADSTITKVALDTTLYDGLNEFDTTNYIFTASEKGYYLVTGAVQFNIADADIQIEVYIYKNGTFLKVQGIYYTVTLGAYITAIISNIIYLDANDYIDFRVAQYSGLAKDIIAGWDKTYFCIHKLSW
jgi:hypothetical protein